MRKWSISQVRMATFSKSSLGLEDAPPREEPAAQLDLLPEPDLSLPEEAVPHLVIQLRDDLSRSRLREAFWISVVTHLLALISLYFAPRLIPVRVIPVR